MVDILAESRSVSGLRQLLLLEKLVDIAPQFPREQVQTAGLYNEGHLWGMDVQALDNDFSVLKMKGWIYYESSLGGIDDVVILQAGRDVVHAFSEERENPVKRNTAIRSSILSWLYEEYNAGNDSPNTTAFYNGKHGRYLGKEITPLEMKRAVEWLVSMQLIEVTPMLNGFTRPIITPQGVDSVELGDRAEAVLLEKGITVTQVNISDSSGVNVAVESSGVQQSNTVTVEQRKNIENFIGSARGMLPSLGLSGDDQTRVIEIVDELDSEASSVVPKQSRARELIGKVLDIAVTGSATAMVNALVAMGESVLASL